MGIFRQLTSGMWYCLSHSSPHQLGRQLDGVVLRPTIEARDWARSFQNEDHFSLQGAVPNLLQ